MWYHDKSHRLLKGGGKAGETGETTFLLVGYSTIRM